MTDSTPSSIDRIYEHIGNPDGDNPGDTKADAILQWIERTMTEWGEDQTRLDEAVGLLEEFDHLAEEWFNTPGDWIKFNELAKDVSGFLKPEKEADDDGNPNS